MEIFRFWGCGFVDFVPASNPVNDSVLWHYELGLEFGHYCKILDSCGEMNVESSMKNSTVFCWLDFVLLSTEEHIQWFLFQGEKNN